MTGEVGDDAVPSELRRLVDGCRGAHPGDVTVRRPAVPAGGRRAAVLALFGLPATGPDLLFIERAHDLRHHAGQAAFPGGGLEDVDGGPVDAALREAVEETGLDAGGVAPLATLPALTIPVSGFSVTPVVAHWDRPSPVHVVDPGETAAVVRVPVAELSDPRRRFTVAGPSGYSGPAFAVGGLLVWGFTAALVDRLLELGGWARPWDTTDARDLGEMWARRGELSEPADRDLLREGARPDNRHSYCGGKPNP